MNVSMKFLLRMGEKRKFEKNACYIISEIRELALSGKNYESETILPFFI